ncbi:hypothetical protein ABZV31_00840 [Streptomyces sp. NPDC005202]|uniref:hypothetical protein n=1 Tax=Streptomyces sp. NPDC005202 TaxID=3157021 RepID=UPI0033B4AE85
MARHTFPSDLIETQRDWDRTYEALARRNPVRTAVLRRRLLALSHDRPPRHGLPSLTCWNVMDGR